MAGRRALEMELFGIGGAKWLGMGMEISRGRESGNCVRNGGR